MKDSFIVFRGATGTYLQTHNSYYRLDYPVLYWYPNRLFLLRLDSSLWRRAQEEGRARASVPEFLHHVVWRQHTTLFVVSGDDRNKCVILAKLAVCLEEYLDDY